MPTASASDTTSRVVAALAIATLGLALLVMLAWVLRLDSLLQFDPAIPTLKVNTALCLVLAAVSLLATQREQRLTAAALAAALLLLAGATLLQHLLDLDLGIDQWLLPDHLSAPDGPRGRMAPITSWYFIGCALALLLTCWRGVLPSAGAFVLGAALLAITLSSLLGYLIDARPLLGWEGGLGVAPHTALAQSLLSIGLLLHVHQQQLRRGELVVPVAGELVLIAGLVFGLLVWRNLVTREQGNQLAVQHVEASWVAQLLNDRVHAPTLPLQRMARRWRVQRGTPEAAWRADAHALIEDVPGLISLQWLDAGGTVRWVEPQAAYGDLVGKRPNQDPARRSLLERARRNDSVLASEPIELLQGGLGILIFAPVETGGAADGFLVGVVRLQDRLHSVLAGASTAWRRRVEFQSRSLYQDVDFDLAAVSPWQVTRSEIEPGRPDWQLVTIPGPQTGARSRLPEMVLASIVLLTVLVQLALLLWARATQAARQSQASNRLLAETNERFRLAADTARIGVWDWHVASNHSVWNDWMYHLFDAERGADDLNAVWRARVHPDDLPRLSHAVERSLNEQLSLDVEYRVVRRDGTVTDLHSHGRPLDVRNGRTTRMIGVALDISERKRLERMQNEFVSTVSHELRTPLTSINGALGLVTSGIVGELPETARDLLSMARNNTQRLTTLINDLLDMEKLLAGGLQLEMRLQPLAPVLRQAVEANRAYAAPLSVNFVENFDAAAEAVQVRADALRLQQVLANLLSNAAKFSAAGSQVEITCRPHQGVVRVEVIDHGRGIPDAFRARVFNKFSQADSSDTRSRGGTGLGLAISRELIERMDGRIGFESSEGAGSTFWFELPIGTRDGAGAAA